MYYLKAIFSLVICTALAFSAHANETELKRTFTGKAVDLEDNNQLYTEAHAVNGDVLTTSYISTGGEVIGERVVNFDGDRVASYQLRQATLDYSESVVREAEQIVITRMRKGEIETKAIKPKEGFDYVIDAGFTNYVQRNWDVLVSGKPQKTYFVSPNRMEALYLELKFKELDDQGVAHFEMNIANRLLKLVVKPIKIGFLQDTKKLAYYAGVSNLQAPDLKYYRVRIDYAY